MSSLTRTMRRRMQGDRGLLRLQPRERGQHRTPRGIESLLWRMLLSRRKREEAK